MIILVLAFLASLIPSLGIYFWLKKRNSDPTYQTNCKNALFKGFLCVFPVLLCSCCFSIIGRILRLKDFNTYLYDVYYKFIVLAFAEELVKFMALRKLLKQKSYSWLDVVIYMVLIGIGFEIIEAIPYAIGSQVGHMIVRGITIMHGAMGFIMGYFYGKALQRKKKGYAVLGFVLSWLMHGTYDFTLTDEIVEIADWIPIIPVSLAAFSIVLIVWFVLFVRNAGKKETYTALISHVTEEVDASAKNSTV